MSNKPEPLYVYWYELWRADELRKFSIASKRGISRCFAVPSDTVDWLQQNDFTSRDVPIILVNSHRYHAALCQSRLRLRLYGRIRVCENLFQVNYGRSCKIMSKHFDVNPRLSNSRKFLLIPPTLYKISPCFSRNWYESRYKNYRG